VDDAERRAGIVSEAGHSIPVYALHDVGVERDERRCPGGLERRLELEDARRPGERELTGAVPGGDEQVRVELPHLV
jgi:hypothetical protein